MRTLAARGWDSLGPGGRVEVPEEYERLLGPTMERVAAIMAAEAAGGAAEGASFGRAAPQTEWVRPLWLVCLWYPEPMLTSPATARAKWNFLISNLEKKKNAQDNWSSGVAFPLRIWLSNTFASAQVWCPESLWRGNGGSASHDRKWKLIDSMAWVGTRSEPKLRRQFDGVLLNCLRKLIN